MFKCIEDSTFVIMMNDFNSNFVFSSKSLFFQFIYKNKQKRHHGCVKLFGRRSLLHSPTLIYSLAALKRNLKECLKFIMEIRETSDMDIPYFLKKRQNQNYEKNGSVVLNNCCMQFGCVINGTRSRDFFPFAKEIFLLTSLN